VLYALSGLRALKGDFDEARRLARESGSIDADLGRTVYAAMGPAEMLGHIEMLAGDPAASERELLRGYETLEHLGEKYCLSTLAAMLGHAICEQGRFDEADEFTRVSEELASRDDLASQVLWHCARGRIRAGQGKYEEAEQLARAGVRLAEQTDHVVMRAESLCDLAEVLGQVGRVGDATELLDEAARLNTQKGNIAAQARTSGLRRGLEQ